MAVMMVTLWWVLVLGGCLAVTVRAECTRECAFCLYGLAGQQAESSTRLCTLECGSDVNLRDLELCKNALSSEDNLVAVGNPEAEPVNPEHLLAKKYGGFMKRYGGFMMKKSSDDLEDASKYDAYSKNKEADGELEKLDILKEILMVDAGPSEVGRELQKRYGGFMPRVGRPQWVEGPKSYGLHKRWREGTESVLPQTQKRYGGFMD
ncbi:proenkephalin a [Trichomycterus rosablanca]|uniref:proenkephalin a n=1 Tax=Trichomycterus rosablanca TaxID=2290929 RepID=UPI002F353F33